MPRLGIKPATFGSTGQCSNQLSHLRAGQVCLYKREAEGNFTDRQRGEESVKAEPREIRRSWSAVATSQSLSAATRGWKRQLTDSLLKAPKGAQPLTAAQRNWVQTSGLHILYMREYICIVLTHQVWSHLLQQPQKTDRDLFIQWTMCALLHCFVCHNKGERERERSNRPHFFTIHTSREDDKWYKVQNRVGGACGLEGESAKGWLEERKGRNSPKL